MQEGSHASVAWKEVFTTISVTSMLCCPPLKDPVTQVCWEHKGPELTDNIMETRNGKQGCLFKGKGVYSLFSTQKAGRGAGLMLR